MMRPTPFQSQDQAKLEMIQMHKKQVDALSEIFKILLQGYPEMYKLLKDQKGSIYFDNESLTRFQNAFKIILKHQWWKKDLLKELDQWLELQELELCPMDPHMAQDKTGKKFAIPMSFRNDLDNLMMGMSEDLGMALGISMKNRMNSIEKALSQPIREERKARWEDQEATDDERQEQ